MNCLALNRAVCRVGTRYPAQFGEVKLAGGAMSSGRHMLSASAYCAQVRNSVTVAVRCRYCTHKHLRKGFLGTLRLDKQQSCRVQQRVRRLRGGSVLQLTRAGIEKKRIKKDVDDFEVGLQKNGGLPELPDDLSQLAVSLPLGLASFEGLFLVGWVASLRGLLPGSRGFFGAADLILCGIMFANCVVGWYALEHSRSEIDELPRDRKARKMKAAGPSLIDLGFSLGVSFIPFANLFLWLRFASRQKHLSTKEQAALVANALIYEGPRLFALLVLISGGLWVLLQVGLVSNVALLLSALHRPFEEARIRNEKVLREVVRAKELAAKEAEDKIPKKKEISEEERDRIDRLRELEEFDMLLAQTPSSGTATLPANPKEWTVGETMEWLGQQGLARYATTFAQNNIDGKLLLQLTTDEVRDELQILNFGDRKKLELLIQELKRR
ncbi:uncharacterized protein [Physcomitrium patens]|uniref:SAM domain-containing protein n=1 Tax=Physcomitrium patens TaxID=3218 RepID=A0A2K1KHE0_PHYPA|nr:uncharacterized protein LOC112283420 isoform X2 [Physcomitrium patens]PNR53179.1 hypothetical protein PHYPA_009554 [Physcomitrium patens]|eukprot:XP_024377826.1 uncharacterized protein LOC112283420 isoform X2 [Physcomitrella patens]